MMVFVFHIFSPSWCFRKQSDWIWLNICNHAIMHWSQRTHPLKSLHPSSCSLTPTHGTWSNRGRLKLARQITAEKIMVFRNPKKVKRIFVFLFLLDYGTLVNRHCYGKWPFIIYTYLYLILLLNMTIFHKHVNVYQGVSLRRCELLACRLVRGEA